MNARFLLVDLESVLPRLGRLFHFPGGLGVAKGAQAAVLPLVQVASR